VTTERVIISVDYEQVAIERTMGNVVDSLPVVPSSIVAVAVIKIV
jgi:hypothetical protein